MDWKNHAPLVWGVARTTLGRTSQNPGLLGSLLFLGFPSEKIGHQKGCHWHFPICAVVVFLVVGRSVERNIRRDLRSCLGLATDRLVWLKRGHSYDRFHGLGRSEAWVSAWRTPGSGSLETPCVWLDTGRDQVSPFGIFWGSGAVGGLLCSERVSAGGLVVKRGVALGWMKGTHRPPHTT